MKGIEDKGDIRWKQRFSNFEKALEKFTEAVEVVKDHSNDLEKEGLIQRFEFSHELAWKVMKDFLENDGYQNIFGSKSTTREAFNKGLIEEGQIWMNMIESRNATVHTYHGNILDTEYHKIIEKYHPLFLKLDEKMKTLL